MNIYNIDGLPGITVSGKQGGENIIIKKTAKRGRMTFYSSNVYSDTASLSINTSIFSYGYVISNKEITNKITFLTNNETPQDYDILIENQNNKLNIYLIFYVEIDKDDIDENTLIKEDYYELKLIDSLLLSSFSQDTLDLNISISSTDITIPKWSGYYKLSYLNRKSEFLYKTFVKKNDNELENRNLNFSKFSYTDSSNNIIPTPKPLTNNFTYYEEHDNYVSFVKNIFNYESSDDLEIYYKSLVNKVSEPFHTVKTIKISDKPNFKGIYINILLKDTNTHELIDNFNIKKINLNCDILYNYDIDLNNLLLYGYEITKEEDENDHNITITSRTSENKIYPYGLNDINTINYKTTYIFDNVECKNGVVSLFIDKDNLANIDDKYYGLSPIYVTIIPYANDNIFNNNAFLLNTFSLISDIYDENNDTSVITFETYLSFEMTSTNTYVSNVRNNWSFISNYMYNFGDLPYFDTTNVSEKDLSKDSSLIKIIDDKESFLKLPAFGLNDNTSVITHIDNIINDEETATVISFTLSSSLTDSELSKYKIIAELNDSASGSNIFKCSTSSCLGDKWESLDEENDKHPNGDSSLFDRNLNFNNENIFPCIFIIKDFDDKFKNNVFNNTINLPIDIASKCSIRLLGYYKKSLNTITKIYLGETSISETYIR